LQRSTRRPGDMTEALSMVKALFDAGIASFAQVLRADGWIPKNLVPMHDTVLTEACRRPRRLAMLDA
jgi:hypothetical protein